MTAKNTKTTRKPAAKKTTKPERPTLIDYPNLPLESATVPADYDRAVHNRLNRKSFANEADYHDFRAAALEASALAHRTTASNIRQFGSGAPARRAGKLVDQLTKLRAELAEQGVEVDLSSLIDG